MPKLSELTVSVSGVVDASLPETSRYTQAELLKIKQAAATLNSYLGKESTQAFQAMAASANQHMPTVSGERRLNRHRGRA